MADMGGKTPNVIDNEARIRRYNDIAYLLWYGVLYNDVLSHLKEKMDTQMEPFRTFDYGNTYLAYGPVKALTSTEKIHEFEKKAAAELRDAGFGKLKVRVYPDRIVVSLF